MLDVETVLPYLSGRGLVPSEWILDGDLTIRSAMRRNRNLIVMGPGGQGFLVKQAGAAGGGNAETLAREAAFYESCHGQPELADLAAWLPALVLHDPEQRRLTLELVPDALALHAAYQQMPGVEALPAGPLASVGRGLGTLHRLFRRPGPADALALSPRLPTSLPWVFQAHRPPLSLLAELSQAGIQVIKILGAAPEIGDRLDALAAEWSAETVIHGDIRSDNILVTGRGGSARQADRATWIIDWEFVQLGDPAWDLGGVLADHLALWTGSMPRKPTLSLGEMAAGARWPLAAIQPALRAFRDGYLHATGGTAHASPEGAPDLFSRAAGYSVARLVLAAFELASERDELPVQAVLLLQLAANLAVDPDGGYEALYGLGTGDLST